MLVLKTPDMPSMLSAKDDIVMPGLAGSPRNMGIVLYDMIGNIWNEAQEHYARTINGTTITEQMAKLREDEKSAMTGGMEGFKGDWKVIRGWYNHVYTHTVTHMACHVFATAGARPLREATDERGRPNPVQDRIELLEIWRDFGLAPEAEKGLTYKVNTAIGLKAWGLVRQYSQTLAKDVSRVPMVPSELWSQDAVPTEQVEITLKSGKTRKVNIFDFWQDYVNNTEGAVYQLPGGAGLPVHMNSDGTFELIDGE
jgi:hypothetical protein